MRSRVALALNTGAVLALGLVLLLPTSKYEWIEQVDASLSSRSFVDTGNRDVVVAFALGLAAVAQLLMLLRKPSKSQRFFSCALLTGVLFVGYSRFCA